MKLSLEKDESMYRAGTYTVDRSSFVINSYGKLELKKYGMKLTQMEVELWTLQTKTWSNRKDTVQELNQLHGFKVDDWFLSSGRCGEIEVHGPYKTADEACKEAKAKYGVTKLTSPMLIF